MWAGPSNCSNEQNTAKVIGYHFHHWVTKKKKKLASTLFVLWKGLQGEEPSETSSQEQARNWGAVSRQRWKKDPAPRHVNKLGSRPSPSGAFRWDCSPSLTATSRDLSQKHPLSWAWIPDPEKLWDSKCYCFKPQNGYINRQFMQTGWFVGLECVHLMDQGKQPFTNRTQSYLYWMMWRNGHDSSGGRG